ncbi:MAG: NAD(P)H-dependent oxidoreductase [Eubacteriales bacterium]|nr:NAD(P)H-dependent oxidoreductase [Eubacteriales bacterium]
MGKKICILNGSPRPNGNTKELIKRFTAGAEAAGHEAACFDLQKMDIHGCLGCCKGGKDQASPCVQKDDMDRIYPFYRAADVVVLASPMYYWGISGQLKCAFDRLFAVAELTPDYENPKKECALLMAAEGGTESNFAPVRAFYEGLAARLGWKNRGVVYAGGNMDAGDILSKPDQLEAAEKLGRSM